MENMIPAGPQHTRHCCPWPSGGKGGAGLVRFTLRLRDQQKMWMQDRCKVYMDSCMASNGWCFMFTWTIFQNQLLTIGLTQNQKTMALWTSQLLIYFILSCVRMHMNKNSLKYHFVKGMVTYDITLHLRIHDQTTWFWRCKTFRPWTPNQLIQLLVT